LRIAYAVFGLMPVLAWAQAPPLVGILAEEMERNFAILKQKGDPPPYYMAYAVTEQEVCGVSATLGALKSSGCDRARVLDVTVRVGSPKLDNYHRQAGERARFAGRVAAPIEDRPAAIKRLLWQETDRVYRLASETLIKLRTSRELKVAEEDDSGDFSQEAPVVHAEAPPRLAFPLEEWAARLRKWSAGFSDHRAVVTSQVSVAARRETKALVSTEGTRLQHGRLFCEIQIVARAKAADGEDLALSESIQWSGVTPPPKHVHTVGLTKARGGKNAGGIIAVRL